MSALKRFWSSLHPKVIAATIGSLLASTLIGGIVAAQASPQMFDGLPSWVIFVFTAMAAPIVTFLSGYSKSGPGTPQP